MSANAHASSDTGLAADTGTSPTGAVASPDAATPVANEPVEVAGSSAPASNEVEEPTSVAAAPNASELENLSSDDVAPNASTTPPAEVPAEASWFAASSPPPARPAAPARPPWSTQPPVGSSDSTSTAATSPSAMSGQLTEVGAAESQPSTAGELAAASAPVATGDPAAAVTESSSHEAAESADLFGDSSEITGRYGIPAELVAAAAQLSGTPSEQPADATAAAESTGVAQGSLTPSADATALRTPDEDGAPAASVTSATAADGQTGRAVESAHASGASDEVAGRGTTDATGGAAAANEPGAAIAELPPATDVSVAAAQATPEPSAPPTDESAEPPRRREPIALDVPDTEQSTFELETTSHTDFIPPSEPVPPPTTDGAWSGMREIDFGEGAAAAPRPGHEQGVPLASAWEFVGWTGPSADAAPEESFELARDPRAEREAAQTAAAAPADVPPEPAAEPEGASDERVPLASAWEFVPAPPPETASSEGESVEDKES